MMKRYIVLCGVLGGVLWVVVQLSIATLQDDEYREAMRHDPVTKVVMVANERGDLEDLDDLGDPGRLVESWGEGDPGRLYLVSYKNDSIINIEFLESWELVE